MPKLFWVSLPLLLAIAGVTLQTLRRHPPSRLALNVGSSVLLLAYLLATAALGIFWVANQQLPVFDWHYLFGYGTVLLVALHLWFNLPAVWRYLERRRTAPTGPRTDMAPGRRGVLGAFGVLLATGAAFAMGLRQGRSELRIDGPAAADGSRGAGMAALSLVERFHAFSSHSRAGVLTRVPDLAWRDPPSGFKRYADAPRVGLPRPDTSPGAVFDLAALGAVLWHTSGVTQTRGGLALRASPSSGALFSTELYIAARSVAGLAAGLWHYDPQVHALERLSEASLDAAALGASETGLAGASAAIVATAVFQRTGHKYRDRTYRYVLADLGHALENLRVASGTVGMQARFVAGFDESRAAATIGLDQAEEGVLALLLLQVPAPGGQASPAPLALVPGRRPQSPVERVSSSAITAALHAATSLRAATAPEAVAHSGPASAGMPARSIALPAVGAVTADWLGVIASRRSVRRFAAAPLPLDALSAILAAMTTRHRPILSPAVRIDVVANAVAALPPGAYRYDAAGHALLTRRAPADLRASARAAALDQDVIGDGAAVFVLSIDRAVLAEDPFGPARGYRHAFLEAGLVGERLYLEAAARGLGACAVGAFYDDEAAALVGADPTREWVVHFAALGVPLR